MRIIYRIATETFELTLDPADDFALCAEETLVALTDAHPELPKGPPLQLHVIDSLLDALASDRDEIDLGELMPFPGK